MAWTVYGLVSPITNMIFYVGITSQPPAVRFAQHRSDPASSAHDTFQYLAQYDLMPSLIIIEETDTRRRARALENLLILGIGGLKNRAA